MKNKINYINYIWTISGLKGSLLISQTVKRFAKKKPTFVALRDNNNENNTKPNKAFV